MRLPSSSLNWRTRMIMSTTTIMTTQHQHAPSLNPELTREIEVEVPAEEVSKSFKTVVKRYQKLARIPGFRAGKVPESLIRSKFAKEVRQEVLESLVSERFRKAIDEQKLRPVSEPQLLDMQLFDGQPLKFKAAFEVAPVSSTLPATTACTWRSPMPR